MAYLQLDDRFPDHPKVVGLTDAAFRAHVAALCYCSEHLTDGVFPKTVGDRLAKPKARKELLASGLWLDSPGGFAIHDFLDWNASREQVLSRIASKRSAGAMGAAKRWGDSKDMAQGVEGSEAGSEEEEVFQRFYRSCPKRVAPGRARKAFRSALKKTDVDTIMQAIEAYAVSVESAEPEYIAHPATWLNGERWNDEATRPALSVADQAARMRGVS